MRTDLKFEGGKDIERALAKIPLGTSKGVARRAIKKELAPVARSANAFSPFSMDDVFKVSSRAKRRGRRDRSEVELFVGADLGDPQGRLVHLFELGTGPRYTKDGAYRGHIDPQPMLRPAWDLHSGEKMLDGLGATLWAETKKTLARAAKRAGK